MDPRRLTLKPVRWLGAPAPGGLLLPAAAPSRETMYAPRGVYFDDRTVIVADSGNHRVLIWHGFPERDHAPADVVLGQPDFTSEGPRLLHLPTAVAVYEGRLFVADAWHHRILIWNEVPTSSGAPPDAVIGQASMDGVLPNRGGPVHPLGLYWPYGMAYLAGRFYIADTGNRRVLGWNGIPEGDRPPDVVLGQPDGYTGLENRGKGVSADAFRWPHALAGDETRLYVADAGNHRVLGFSPHPPGDRPADLVLGQSDFNRNFELPHVPQGPRRMRFPYGVALCAFGLAVADTANNRVLLFADVPERGAFYPAQAVLGQADFEASGENRWQGVAPDTLCWPYGLWCHKGRLAVADTGNNRVMFWELVA
ncbi:MAG: NHL repeat-containing protein [Hydrogenibacillus schlegelii]|uniref:NHL repeat-containing protein n=1 Tax=Hydrogenibacillus schlegelii TaxID=1484 RepID=A0A2T5GCA3_HYDSH|nr:NHL repeat-containing protein [Hydrogenibacillus schlegelii]MBT9281815.1 NHL repeat-containing protein [Hydrogenibacillus schlegelii]PTQ53833.1 MAG: NHL repeat containing protein [Hydrogenibacillus schlegelii]